MVRRARIFFPGATYHIMLRGNNGIPVFLSDEERCRFCLLMQEGVERFGHRIIAFCFMTNHVHLALQVAEVSHSQILHNIAFRYTQFFNRRHQRTGHLFQSRFRSILVDSGAYLKELIRYIHLNPVRAGLVGEPQDYRWSSHRAYLRQEHFCWLATSIGLDRFTSLKTPNLEAFHRFVLDGVGLEPSAEFRRGITNGILGSEEFIRDIDQRFHEPNNRGPVQTNLQTLISAIERTYGLTPEELRRPKRDRRSSHIRAVTAYIANEAQGVSLRELADYFHQDSNAVYKAASRLAARLQTSGDLQQEIDGILSELAPAHV